MIVIVPIEELAQLRRITVESIGKSMSLKENILRLRSMAEKIALNQ
jgi:hypothetical protein